MAEEENANTGRKMTIGVDIAVLNDPKLFDTLNSMREQSLKPELVLIADGGSPSEYIEKIRNDFSDLPLKIAILPGSHITTKNASIDHITTDIVAFLDSDEVAPREWLATISKPIVEGKADFTGGPTRPPGEPRNSIERYYNELERRIYEGDVEQDVVYMPLGNTAWKTFLLKHLRFDRRIVFRGGAPDYDLEMRAVDAGYRGLFVRDAWVYHNKGTVKGYRALVKHRYRYLVGAAVVMIKNGRLRKRAGEKRTMIKMPFAYVEELMKPIALVHAFIYWEFVVKRKE
ncbi:MAG: glycosyltransferase family 2 protein [Candidatus Thermoplasmatota archaeon]|nr:glycosyltransferase family 2 protein [Candidatus Sysuiplasma jiujiangense]MBX8642265.1 glycosyltransferase family 2 protein [Candidatus Sysuiplasma jiujiangense]MCL5677835.1 glycosyltransferase family 2 protein [Candidatus Thermoplasmatota archaeon]